MHFSTSASKLQGKIAISGKTLKALHYLLLKSKVKEECKQQREIQKLFVVMIVLQGLKECQALLFDIGITFRFFWIPA